MNISIFRYCCLIDMKIAVICFVLVNDILEGLFHSIAVLYEPLCYKLQVAADP